MKARRTRERTGTEEAAPGRAQKGRWGRLLLAGAGLVALASPASAQLLVDDFTSGAQALCVGDPLDSPGPCDATALEGLESVFHSVDAPAALGGERDVTLERTAVEGTETVRVGINDPINEPGQDVMTTELLLFDGGVSSETRTLLVWDGMEDMLPEEVTADGLGSAGSPGLDLLAEGQDAFRLRFNSALEIPVRLRVYDAGDPDGQTWSETEVILRPTDGLELSTQEVLFESFVTEGPAGPADFRQIGAIELEITGNPGADLLLDSVQVVPEPGAAPVAALGALVLLARWRRRMARA